MYRNSYLEYQAFKYAKKAHHGQTRKYSDGKVPYIVHPTRVAARVMCLDESTHEMVAAAYLHDVIEDCDVWVGDLIIDGFPQKIVCLVEEVTNPSREHKHLKRAERKAMDREHLKGISREGKLIKLCDRIDNLKDLSLAKSDFKQLYLQESQKLYEDALRGLDPTLDYEYNQAIEALRYDIATLV